MNLPTAVTLLRFPLAFAFPFVDGLAARIAIIVAAGVSEWLDGRLARARGETTQLGELLDPIADKTFVLVVLVTLIADGTIPLRALPLLALRDIGVALGVAFVAFRGIRMRMPARMPGKIVTWLQFMALVVLLLSPGAVTWVAPVIAIAGAIALADYARAFRERLASPDHAG